MTDGGPAAAGPPSVPGAARAARTARRWARFLGFLSVLVFFVPIVAPLVQAGTLVYVLSASWRGSLDRTSVIVGAAGSVLGFVLFLATEYFWVV